MSKVPQHLIDEATRRGIVEGAIACSPYGKVFIVGPMSGWVTNSDGTGVANGDGSQIFSDSKNSWATVITPAPAPEGLKEGDAVECGPAMRAAIIELAKELGIHGRWNLNDYPEEPGVCLYWNGYEVHSGPRRSNHTPEAFIAKMRVNASLPRPIIIDGNVVKWEKGFIKVGCQEIPNDTVRAIAAKLIDP